MDAQSLRDLADNLKAKLPGGIIVLAATGQEKLSFIVSVSPDLIKTGYAAGAIAKNIAGIIGGSGGGRPEFAQGGGKNAEKLDEAFSRLPELLSRK
jgi:alanyl-tRNA synthetase